MIGWQWGDDHFRFKYRIIKDGQESKNDIEEPGNANAFVRLMNFKESIRI